MTERDEHFDDPALRSAVRRLYAGERAPLELRDRVIAMAGAAGPAEPTPDASPARLPFWNRARALRIAAVIVFVLIGALAVVLYDRQNTVLADATFQAMVRTHKHCCSRGAHSQPTVRQDTPAAAGTDLAAQIHAAVLAADLRQDEWSFEGGALCDLGDGKSPCAHLVFSKGANRCKQISIFSLPLSACPGAKPGRYARTVDGCPVVAVVTDKSVYCFVGYCHKQRLTSAEILDLVSKHEKDVCPSSAGLVPASTPADPGHQ
jgi:hypothetical protein